MCKGSGLSFRFMQTASHILGLSNLKMLKEDEIVCQRFGVAALEPSGAKENPRAGCLTMTKSSHFTVSGSSSICRWMGKKYNFKVCLYTWISHLPWISFPMTLRAMLLTVQWEMHVFLLVQYFRWNQTMRWTHSDEVPQRNTDPAWWGSQRQGGAVDGPCEVFL